MPGQWLKLHDLAHERANGTIRLTTRQTIQFHGIIKSNLKPAIRAIHDAMLDTIAACGDVNRGVICSANPYQPPLRAEVTGARPRAQRPFAAAYPRLARDLGGRGARGGRGGG